MESMTASPMLTTNGASFSIPGSNASSAARSMSGKSVHWNPELSSESPAPGGSHPHGISNPYIQSAPVVSGDDGSFSIKESMVTVKDMLGRWRRRVVEATKKAEDLAGNTWQHLKTGPSFSEAALGRIAQGTKILAEGGYEKVFRHTFETEPDEQLQNSFACYLSTSVGPVMGILYASTEKLAFSSDSPMSYESDHGQTEWSYYKVIIPLHQLKAVNHSSSRTNASEKYIQVICIDNLEFWFMGFLNYDGAVNTLQDALHSRTAQSV